MSILPNGWCHSDLGSLIARIESGLNVKCIERPPKGRELGLVKISAVTWGRFNQEQSKTLPPDVQPSVSAKISIGDLLISRANTIELVGATVIVDHLDKRLYLSDKVLRLVVPEESKRWINFALKTQAARKAIQDGSSGNQLSMRNISQDKLRAISIPFAPLPEQKRIADKLDTVLARVDACRERLNRVPLILKRFRQSVLAAATSGQLTADWREQQVGWADAGSPTSCDADASWASQAQPNLQTDEEKNLIGWINTDVQSVATVGTGSTPLRSNTSFFAETGTPWVTSAATSAQYVSHASEYVTTEAIKAHRLKCYPVGTLLVAMYGEGKTRGQVSELAITATINQACAAVIVDETRALRAFVKLTLQANYLEMREMAEGGNQPNLNLSKIKEFKLRLPTLQEQHEIVRRVETLFAFADRLEARLATARAATERLTPALLAKAFRGELVPQDPDDEPAAALLQRLAASRAEAGAKPRRARAAKV